MWPDRVSNPGPLTYESGVLPIALRGPASRSVLHRELSEMAEQSELLQSIGIVTELQLRGGIDDNSKIVFLFIR